MASIQHTNGRVYVMYYFTDEFGNKKQKKERMPNEAAAKKRKAEIEYMQQVGTFVAPSDVTVSELLKSYIENRAGGHWSVKTYSDKVSLVKNYIEPYIGNWIISDVTPKMIEQYYNKLRIMEPVTVNNKKPKNSSIGSRTIEEIHKLLRGAFQQAVNNRDSIIKNPVLSSKKPVVKSKERKIWDIETFDYAVNNCEDPILKLAMYLAFSCSLRTGELLGLTWDCVHIINEDKEYEDSYIYINKELQRINKEAVKVIGTDDILYLFPTKKNNTTTRLALKTPKTEKSVRKVFLPPTMAKLLIERKNQIEYYKDVFRNEYTDYNLVLCHTAGSPIEASRLDKIMKKFIKDKALPPVEFYSIRHLSITYKLKWNQGDIKSTQGDAGHSNSKMVTDVYSHILDEGRKNNADLVEANFFSKQKSDSEIPSQELSDEMLAKLFSDPETQEKLRAFLEKLDNK